MLQNYFFISSFFQPGGFLSASLVWRHVCDVCGLSSDGISVQPAAAEHERLLPARSAAILQPTAAAARRPQPAAVHAAPTTATAGRTRTPNLSSALRSSHLFFFSPSLFKF